MKYSKLVLSLYPLFVLAEEDKKEVVIGTKSYVIGGGGYAAYVYPVSDSFGIGAYAGAIYGTSIFFAGTAGLLARYNLDWGFVSGFRLMGGALLGAPVKDLSSSDTALNPSSKEVLQSLNNSKNGVFKGGYAVLALELPWGAVGTKVEYGAQGQYSKGFSVGVIVMPSYSVSENVEVGLVGFGSYLFKKSEASELFVNVEKELKTRSEAIEKVIVDKQKEGDKAAEEQNQKDKFVVDALYSAVKEHLGYCKSTKEQDKKQS